MLGPDVVMIESVGLFPGQGQHLLRSGSKVVHHFKQCVVQIVTTLDKNIADFGFFSNFLLTPKHASTPHARSNTCSACVPRFTACSQNGSFLFGRRMS